MQFIWFLGRFHVLIVHLPLGILTLAVGLEILSRFKPFRHLNTAAAAAWVAGAITSLATVALGFMHATEDSFQGMAAVEAHRWAGTSLAIVTCLIAVLRLRMHPVAAWPRWAGPEGVVKPAYGAIQPAFARGSKLDRGYDKLWGAPVAIILALMFLTGHLGGNLTHGDTYLVQYAPGPIRMLAGLPAHISPQPRPIDKGDEQVASAPAAGEAPLPQVAEADKAAVAKVVDEGFIVRKVDKASNLLVVDYISPKPVTPEVIADLARFGPNILRLNLRHAGVTDAMVKSIAGFKNLRRLRLEQNDVTDAAARDIATLKDLSSVNLTNTKVTDAGLQAVSQLPKLQRLYVWSSAISPAAVDKIKGARKDVIVYAGLTAKDVPVETRIVVPDN